MELHIRNMVCDRCIKAVNGLLREVGADGQATALGVVNLATPLGEEQLQRLRARLAEEGFELLDDRKIQLVELVKQQIIQLVHYSSLEDRTENLSDYLAVHLHRDYSSLSNLFSSVENYTIEHYFILQKIEKVKEWLVYDELSLSEMAIKLGYSSVAHLSAQFRKITGFTPTQFKKLKDHQRKPLDGV